MKLRVAWLGRQTASPYESEVETYRQRVHRRWPAEDRPVRASSGGRDKDPERALRLEAGAVMRCVEPGWRLVVLDEHGRARTSEEFAKELSKIQRYQRYKEKNLYPILAHQFLSR